MKIEDLFPLYTLSSEFDEYYVDADMNVYSSKAGTLYKMKGSTPSNTTHQYWNFTYRGSVRTLRKDQLRNLLEANNAFKTWKSNNMQKINQVSTMTGVSKGFIVGSMTLSGGLSFSAKPHLHQNEQAARAECERLANLYPGKTFVLVEIKGSVKSSGLTWN